MSRLTLEGPASCPSQLPANTLGARSIFNGQSRTRTRGSIYEPEVRRSNADGRSQDCFHGKCTSRSLGLYYCLPICPESMFNQEVPKPPPWAWWANRTPPASLLGRHVVDPRVAVAAFEGRAGRGKPLRAAPIESGTPSTFSEFSTRPRDTASEESSPRRRSSRFQQTDRALTRTIGIA